MTSPPLIVLDLDEGFVIALEVGVVVLDIDQSVLFHIGDIVLGVGDFVKRYHIDIRHCRREAIVILISSAVLPTTAFPRPFLCWKTAWQIGQVIGLAVKS